MRVTESQKEATEIVILLEQEQQQQQQRNVARSIAKENNRKTKD
jgi:hypothetical protein